MTAFKPGRLRRLLDRVVGPGTACFALTSGAGTFYEDDIHEVTIHRGKQGRGGGLHPSTLEVKVRGQLSATTTNSQAKFFLREVPADRIAEHLDGASSGASLADRYVGRIGTMEVDDTGKRFATTMNAASWTARMLRRSRVTYPLTGQSPAAVIRDAVGLNEPNPPAGLSMSTHGPFDTIASDQDPINFRDAVKRYGEDIGVCLLESRAGHTRIASIPYREAQAVAKASNWFHLIRGQAIAPAKWEQNNDAPALTVKYNITNENGNTVTRTAEVATWDPTPETITLDWTYMQSQSNGTSGQSYNEAYGRVFESNARSYTLPTVRVDLIHLIGSDTTYHRLIAAQLLRMEVGDPVFLSGDWPSPLRGVHFAEGITEHLNSGTWELELSLAPWSHVIGGTTQPAIPPRLWDSSQLEWDEETRTWNEAN